MLRQHYPHVHFIQSDRNIGFAKANNEAFRVSRGKNILFLNPDTEIKADAIQRLLLHLESLPDAGVVGAMLVNTDRTVQTSCIRSFPNILNEALDLEELRHRYPHSRLWGMAPLYHRSEKPVEVDAISGACMLVRRSVFEKVAMFSTYCFMYSEDIDLCFKIVKAGFKNYYVPSSVVIHHGGGSSAKSALNTFASVMISESQFRFFAVNRSILYAWLYRLSVILASMVRIATLGILVLLKSGPASFRNQDGKTAVSKWLSRMRWAIGLESWVKTY
jgi:hypothetical protein